MRLFNLGSEMFFLVFLMGSVVYRHWLFHFSLFFEMEHRGVWALFLQNELQHIT